MGFLINPSGQFLISTGGALYEGTCCPCGTTPFSCTNCPDIWCLDGTGPGALRVTFDSITLPGSCTQWSGVDTCSDVAFTGVVACGSDFYWPVDKWNGFSFDVPLQASFTTGAGTSVCIYALGLGSSGDRYGATSPGSTDGSCTGSNSQSIAAQILIQCPILDPTGNFSRGYSGIKVAVDPSPGQLFYGTFIIDRSVCSATIDVTNEISGLGDCVSEETVRDTNGCVYNLGFGGTAAITPLTTGC